MQDKKSYRISVLPSKTDIQVINQYKQYGDQAWINANDRFSKTIEEKEKVNSDEIDQFHDISINNQIDINKNLVESFEQHLNALQAVDQLEKVFTDFFQQVEKYKRNLDQYIQTCMNRNLDGKDQKQTSEYKKKLQELKVAINNYLKGIQKEKIAYAKDPTDNSLATAVKDFLQAERFNDFINFLTQAAKPVESYVFGQNDTDEIKFAQTFKIIFDQLQSIQKIGFKNDEELAELIENKKQQAMQIIEDRVKLNGIILISKEFVKNFESLYLVVDTILNNYKELDFNHPALAGLFGTCMKLKNLQANIGEYLEKIKNSTDGFEKDTSVENLEKLADEIQAILNSNEIKEMISLIGSVTKNEKLTPDLIIESLEQGKFGSKQELNQDDQAKKKYIIESKARFMQVITRIDLLGKDVVKKIENMPKSGSTAHEKLSKALENIQPKINEVNDYPKLLEAFLVAPMLILQGMEIETNKNQFNDNLKNLLEKFSKLEKNSSANFYRQEILQAIQQIDKKIYIEISNFISKSKLKIFFNKNGGAAKILEKLNINAQQEITGKIQCLVDKFELLCELVKNNSVPDFENYIKKNNNKEESLSSGSNSASNESVDGVVDSFEELFCEASNQSIDVQEKMSNLNQQEERSNCQIF